MKKWIVVTDGDDNEIHYPIRLIECKDCKRFDRYTTVPKKYQHDGFCQWWARDTYLDYWCCGAERKEE